MYKRLCMVVFLICLAGTVFAINIGNYGDLDTILNGIAAGGSLPPGFLDELMTMYKNGHLSPNEMNNALNVIEDDVVNYLKDHLTATYTNPQELIRGFANASVFASHSAAQRGCANYKDFSFTLGAMAGLRLPGGILSPVKDIANAANRLADDPDINLGVNMQAVNAQLGINFSRLVNGLYMGIRYTYYTMHDYEDFNLSAYTVGAVAHYQLIKGKDAENGWHPGFKWRGITIGTGLLFSKTVLNAGLGLDDFESYGFTARKPEMNLEVDIITFTVPLEIYTAAFILWFLNVHAGFGVDLAFGRNSTSIELSTTLSTANGKDLSPIEVSGGGTMRPSLINPKIMGGIGFQFGPVIFEIPVSYYFFMRGSGLSLGVTIGVVL